MKTLKIDIKGNFQDGYLYGGQLFLMENSGLLRSIPLWTIIADNLRYKTDEYNFFQLVFTRNDWFNNKQADSYFKISNFRKNFDILWKKYTKGEYIFTIPDRELQVHQKLDTTPTFDFLLYGMRMYVGNGDGLFESPISIDTRATLNYPLKKVFDAKTTQISAKSGSVMISSNTDGLFHGKILHEQEKLYVNKNSISPKSIRTGWSGYDVVNYESQKHFNYLISDYEATEKRQYLYSLEDESSKKISINSVGERTLSGQQVMQNLNFGEDDVVYSFNSSKSCFFFLNDGSFVNTYFRKDNVSDNVKLSSRIYKLPKNGTAKSKVDKPISSKIIPNGCIIEYFDKVVLIHNNKKNILENKPATSIKTFPNSLRYKNIIAIFDGEGVALHCLFPFQ